MRRADRLFLILQYLRARRLTTARWLADRLGVSLRTVYRDVRDLMLSGVPVEGEAGVGYALRHSVDLPPLQFTAEELRAVALGLRFVQSHAPGVLATSGSSAFAKIKSVVPRDTAAAVEDDRLLVPLPSGGGTRLLEAARKLIEARRKVHLAYRDERGVETRRVVRPLALFYFGAGWVLTGWCELRTDFRSFRLDRVIETEPLPDTFEEEPGRSLQDYLRRLELNDRVPLLEMRPELV